MTTAATYQPFQSAYRNYLAGLAPGFGQAYQAQTAPLAQLAYWSAPAASGTGDWGYSPVSGTATNPFAQFLTGGMGTFGTGAGGGAAGYTPLNSGQWRQRAIDVQSALKANPFGNLTTATEDEIEAFTPEQMAQLRIQQRFGMGQGDTAQQLANQQALVNAAVQTYTPMALQGENAAILQRMYDTFLGSGSTDNYLSQMQNVWGGFIPENVLNPA